MTLYEITNFYQEIMYLAEDPEADPECIDQAMEELDDELSVKADSYVTVIKHLEGDNDTDSKEIARLQARVNTRKRNIDKMKANLMTAMDAAGRDKLPTEHYRLSIAKNGGLAPLVIDKDVPTEYCRSEPDNMKIREALKKGDLEFAHLGERGTHLAIR